MCPLQLQLAKILHREQLSRMPIIQSHLRQQRIVGTMTFRYTVTDADGDSDEALVTISVKAGVNKHTTGSKR
jgi:hypothetical protein